MPSQASFSPALPAQPSKGQLLWRVIKPSGVTALPPLLTSIKLIKCKHGPVRLNEFRVRGRVRRGRYGKPDGETKGGGPLDSAGPLHRLGFLAPRS